MGTAHPEIGPVIVRKVPTQFSPIEMLKFSFIPSQLEVTTAQILLVKRKRVAASSSLKSENTDISALSKANRGTVSCLL